jgi:hypothetical protein
VLEHCASLEPFLDICIASGFSLGAAKSTGKIFQAEIEFLGDIVGREGLRSTEKHLDAVKHFGEVNDIEAMRRFLGAFGWVRKSYPKEVIAILPTLTHARRCAESQTCFAEPRYPSGAPRDCGRDSGDYARPSLRASRRRMSVRVGRHSVPGVPV